MAAEERLAPDSTSCRERGRHYQIHVPRGGSRSAGRVIGTAYLAEDLGFSQDLRIQARRNQEQMTHGREPVVPEQLRGEDATTLRDLTKPGLQVLVARPIKLTAVTGGKQEGRSACREMVLQQCSGLGRAEREWLAFLDAGYMMADANEMEGEVRKHVEG
jgi:hypothetical protein